MMSLLPTLSTDKRTPTAEPVEFMCDLCAIRQEAAENPESLKASAWRLHTRVCPMWTSYRAATGTANPPLEQRDIGLLAVGVSVVMTALGFLAALVVRLLTRRPA